MDFFFDLVDRFPSNGWSSNFQIGQVVDKVCIYTMKDQW